MIKQTAQVWRLASGKYFVCDAGYLELNSQSQTMSGSPKTSEEQEILDLASSLLPHSASDLKNIK